MEKRKRIYYGKGRHVPKFERINVGEESVNIKITPRELAAVLANQALALLEHPDKPIDLCYFRKRKGMTVTRRI